MTATSVHGANLERPGPSIRAIPARQVLPVHAEGGRGLVKKRPPVVTPPLLKTDGREQRQER